MISANTQKILQLIGLIVLTTAIVIACEMPRIGWELMGALIIYTLLLWRNPAIWIALTPIVLACANFYPWTGRFFLEEFDAFLMLTLGVSLIRFPRKEWLLRFTPPIRLSLWIIAVSVLISTFLGLWPLPSLDANAFADYLQPYNALRVSRGYIWALCLIAPLVQAFEKPQQLAYYWLRGLTIALLIVSIFAIRERYLYSGIFDFNDEFRVVSTFASMHIGGGHIGAFLTIAIPACLVSIFRDPVDGFRWLSGLSLVFGIYTLLVTFARSAWFGSLVGIGVVIILSLLVMRRGRSGLHFRKIYFGLYALLISVVMGFLLVNFTQGGFFKTRVEAIPQDIDGRLNIVRSTLSMMDGTPLSYTLGMGQGKFPRTFYEWRKLEPPGRYISGDINSQTLTMRHGTSDDFYLVGQRIDIQPHHKYRLQIFARSPTKTDLSFQIHERSIINSKGGIELNKMGPFTPEWRFYETSFDSGALGSGFPGLRPNVVFFFVNFPMQSIVELGEIKLMDEEQKNIIWNGDFSKSHDGWYFESADHTAYQAKNTYIGTFFEQGIIGLGALILLITLALSAIPKAMVTNPALTLALAGGVLGSCVVFLTDNPLIVPRLTILFLLEVFMLMLLGCLSNKTG